MYAWGLRGLWYPAKPYLNPHMGMVRERRIDNYRESEMRMWKCEGSDRSAGHEFCLQLYVSHYVCVSTFEGDRLGACVCV